MRIGDLVPSFRGIVRELVREMPLPDPVPEALERWDALDRDGRTGMDRGDSGTGRRP